MPPPFWLFSQIEILLQHRLGLPVQIVPGGRRDKVGADATARFGVEGETHDLFVRAMGSFKRTALEMRPPSSIGWILAVPELSASVRDEMRKRNLNYVDLAGNVFIHEPGLYVMLEGDRKPPRQRPSSGRQLNPFSKKASLLLRALLEEPGRAWGVRKMAAETRLSVGHASEIAQVLIRRGYARDENGRVSLNDGVAALRDWSALYAWTKNRVSSFVVPFDHDEVGPRLQRAMDAAEIPFAFTLLAGAQLVAPHVQHGQTHLYVPADKIEHSAEVVREVLYGEPVSTGGTLHLLDPYYRDGVFYGSRRIDAMPVVSPVQLFLDLAHFPLRGAEAARMVALGPLAEQLGLDRRRMQELTRTVE